MTDWRKKESDWKHLHDAFRLDPCVTFMDAMVIGSHPATVREAIARHQDGLDRDPWRYVKENWRLLDGAAEAAARYLGLEEPGKLGPELIALTDSTTMGLGLLYNGIVLQGDQSILSPDVTPYFTKQALDHRAAFASQDQDPGEVSGERRIPMERLRTVALYDELSSTTEDEIVSRVEGAIDESTRIVALTWVLSSTGLKLPVGKICKAIAEVNAREERSEDRRILVVVDGVHGVGVEDDTFEELGCDFLVSGCHKWLFGPRGTGFVCGRADAWKFVVPTIPTLRFTTAPGRIHSPGGIHTYSHRWALIEAFELHLTLGKRRIRERTHDLAKRLKKGLASIEGVTVVTPTSKKLSSGVVCCSVGDMSPWDVDKALRLEHFVSASVSVEDRPERDGEAGKRYVRFSPSVRNSFADVDRTVDAVRAIAEAGA